MRVANVAYRISIANAALCDAGVEPQSGLVLHSIDQYGPADRDEAARAFGLDHQVAVMAVVAGSPAESAGFHAGDQLIAVNGLSLKSSSITTAPTRAAVDHVQSRLLEEMRQGSVIVRVAGSTGERDVRYLAEVGCASEVELIPGAQVNAWADGFRVMITEGMLRRSETDDDLALVIGHEMAHNLLHHRQRLAAVGVVASRLLPLTEAGSVASRETEEEADRLAVRLATNAAYDLSGAETFLGGLLDGNVAVAATHPAPDRRLALLRTAIAEASRPRQPAALRQ